MNLALAIHYNEINWQKLYFFLEKMSYSFGMIQHKLSKQLHNFLFGWILFIFQLIFLWLGFISIYREPPCGMTFVSNLLVVHYLRAHIEKQWCVLKFMERETFSHSLPSPSLLLPLLSGFLPIITSSCTPTHIFFLLCSSLTHVISPPSSLPLALCTLFSPSYSLEVLLFFLCILEVSTSFAHSLFPSSPLSHCPNKQAHAHTHTHTHTHTQQSALMKH